MHQYLRAIGFSKYNRKQFRKIIEKIIEHPDEKVITEEQDGTAFVQLESHCAEDFSVKVCGIYNEEGIFEELYYIPVFEGYEITTYEKPIIERHAAQESYSGLCDDFRVGIAIIFYLSNVAEYKKLSGMDSYVRPEISGVKLTGLADRGTILMPVAKTQRQRMEDREASIQRIRLITDAKNGDEQAMESLTMEDLDTFSMIGRRIESEDVLTIVESYFMPRGIECDLYSIMGEIVDYRMVENCWTREKVYIIQVNCNEIYFDLCINEQDLYGVPDKGRRIKADIWLQGQVVF